EPDPQALAEQRRRRCKRNPLVSVLVAVQNSGSQSLVDMIKSVLKQTYANWELWLSAEEAAAKELASELSRWELLDSCVHILTIPSGHAAELLNAAFTSSAGEYISFLGEHDALAPFALFEIIQILDQERDADLIYSDEDLWNPTTRSREQPHFKPDWSPDTFRSHNYIGNFVV